MPLLLKSCDELYISSIPYAFILILFFALLTKCPPLYHQIVNNFSVFCNLFWTIRPLFGQILITCFKNFNAWLSSVSYWQKGKTCTGVDVVECIFCIVPFHWLIFSFFRVSMPVISGTANLMECGFLIVSLYYLRFPYLNFLREWLSSNLFWKNFSFNFGGRVYLIETSRKILTIKGKSNTPLRFVSM